MRATFVLLWGRQIAHVRDHRINEGLCIESFPTDRAAEQRGPRSPRSQVGALLILCAYGLLGASELYAAEDAWKPDGPQVSSATPLNSSTVHNFRAYLAPNPP